MLKWLFGIALAGILIIVVSVAVNCELSSQIPTPKAEYQDCLQRYQAPKEKAVNCKPSETVLERSRTDPVSYFTIWLTGFTGVLALVGIFQGMLIFEQVKLGRREFETAHRPWLAIRDPDLPKAAVHIDQTKVTIKIKYNLANTDTVPALDVICVSSLAPETVGEKEFRKIVRANFKQYKNGHSTEFHKNQNFVVFPKDESVYEIELVMPWNDPIAEASRTPRELSTLLAVSAFYYRSTFSKYGRMCSSCVHSIDIEVDQPLLNAAKAGTGIMLDGKITKWNIGWTAT